LSKPQAFPYPLAPGTDIPLIQTHASAVLLAGDRVYKLKKAHDFGFFDYSTPALRQHFCEQEVLLNSRLAPQVYQGVAPVLVCPAERFRFGPTCAPGHIPAPGATIEDGRVIDYAVVMQRLPEEATLAARVAAGTATPALLTAVAAPIARFHTSGPTTRYISDFGSLRVVQGNWDENFAQMRPYIGRVLDQATFERISLYIHAFLAGYSELFHTRVHEGHIRDCHGDLRLQHIYILEHPDTLAIYVVDCIEFNERFRYSDVAAEIAFLTMELDAAGERDLSRAFVEAYVGLTGDQALYELLPFYACYRACVRGKVLALQLDQPEVPALQRASAQQDARAFFTLAASYASGPTRPTLLLIGGLIGTGKSTLAHMLSDATGWPIISSDTTRKRLAGVDAATPQPYAPDAGLYSPAWNARVYQTILDQASALLASGRSVILDATFAQRAYRHAAAQEAAMHGAHLVFIECQAPREITLARLAQRWQARLAQQPGLASADSDARPELYDAHTEAWQPFYGEEEPATEHLLLSTATTIDLAHILNALGIPHQKTHHP
jgi:aminoglycoside phosphotransferase family enzyme/predicted kinase